MNSSRPRVSVVIPAFNAAATLSETFDCLIAQSLIDWEAVVVDDGSNDATWDIAQHRSQDDARIRVLRQENAGASAARNTGIAAARAPLLVFLDSDDSLAHDHLARLSEALEMDGAAVAYCGYLWVRSDGFVLAAEPCAEISERPFEVFADRCAAAIHCFMVRRDLVEEVGGFDTDLATCEDWDLWQRIARIGVRFTRIPSSLAYYRTRRNSLSGDRRQMVRDAIKVISRAQGPDPRVRAPDPQHADGAKTVNAMESAALFAIWCAASEAAMGGDVSTVLDEITQFPDLRSRLDAASGYIFSGMIVGGQLMPAETLAAWPTVCTQLSPLLARIEQASGDSSVGYHMRSALKAQILAADPLHEPVILTPWMGLRVDVRKPVATILPLPGIDGIHCRICAGDMVLAKVELPVLGAISATSLAGAIVEAMGLRTLLRHGRLIGRVRFWQALLAESISVAPALARAAALFLIKERAAPLRALVRNVLRKSVRTALVKPEKWQSLVTNELYAEQLLARERAVALESCQPIEVARAKQLCLDTRQAESTDRKAFWEKTFETHDPRGYQQSVYEQRKYAQTLSLLNNGVNQALELGCAEGVFTGQLAAKVGHLIAADISERALDRARARCRANQNIEFRQLDFFDEPIPHGSHCLLRGPLLSP